MTPPRPAAASAPVPAAVRLLTGGRILGAPGATALVTEGELITFVGSDDQARQYASGAPETTLAGRLLTPAFVDAHLHAVQTGQMMAGLDLHQVPSRTALLDAVAAYVTRHRSGVVVGQGWDEREWADPRPPTRTELDRAGSGAAVYLARIDVHSAVVSTALLAQLPDVSDAVGFSADGLLTREAHHLCRGRMDRLFSDAERRAAARAALRSAAALGVAWVHELGGPHLGPLEDLTRVADVGGELGLGVVTYWGELASPDALERARRVGAAGLAGDLCVDGAIGSRTAALWQPYADASLSHPYAVEGHADAGHGGDGRDLQRGARYLDDAEIANHVEQCTREGLQAGFHCIGDEAVAAAVSGLRAAATRLGAERVRAARHRLEHVEMVDPTDFATLADLGVVASVQPAFDALWGGPDGLYQARLGRRADTMNPLAGLHAAGVRLALGTDAPVTPLAGWDTVRSAVQHWRPEERLTPTVAFDAATRGAHAAARADGAGTLTVGARADLAWWDCGPDRLDGDGLPSLAVGEVPPTCWATWSAGALVYADPAAGLPAG